MMRVLQRFNGIVYTFLPATSVLRLSIRVWQSAAFPGATVRKNMFKIHLHWLNTHSPGAS